MRGEKKREKWVGGAWREKEIEVGGWGMEREGE